MLEILQEYMMLIIPFLVIELGLRIYAVIDILKEDRYVRGDNKLMWIFIVAFINFAWAIYFIIGPKDRVE